MRLSLLVYGWFEKFNETSLPEKKVYITDLDYNHAKRIYRDFKIKNLSEDHNLYLTSDTF